MSKKKTKKEKNKQKNISSNSKKTKVEEKKMNNKKENVKEKKSDKNNKNKKDIKKANSNENGNIVKKLKNDDNSIVKKSENDDNSIAKKSKNDDSSIQETKKYDNNTENGGIGKNVIRQGNKLIFSDTGNEITSASGKASGSTAAESDTSSNTASEKQHNTDRGSFFENKLDLAVMSKKERRAAKKAAYKEYTSTMSGKEKVSYFFYCYKWHIIIPICCVLLIACYGIAFYRNSRPVALSYTVLNAEEFDKTFHADYLSYFNMPENHVVKATAGYIVNYDYYKKNTVSASREGTNYNTLALTCQAGTFDVIIGDGAGIKYCTFVEIVKPLDLYFTEEQYSALEDYIVKFQDSSYTFYPYAIDISDTEFAKGLNLEYSKVYMAFPGVSEENMTNSLRLLEYVLGIELVE